MIIKIALIEVRSPMDILVRKVILLILLLAASLIVHKNDGTGLAEEMGTDQFVLHLRLVRSSLDGRVF